MSLKLRFLIVCLFTMTITVGMAILGIAGKSRFVSDINETTAIASVVRNHTIADMVHDGLRSDVFVALSAGDTGATQTEVEESANEKIALFESVLDENSKAEVSGHVKQLVSAVRPPLEEYVQISREMIRLAFVDRPAALKKLPVFNKSFESLETAMAEAGDNIEKEADLIDAKANSFGNVATWITWIAVVVATMGDMLLIWFVFFRVTRPISAIERNMAALSGGRTDITIPYLKQKDEIGKMARAIEIFRENEIDRARLEKAALAERQHEKQRQDNLDVLVQKFRAMISTVIGEFTTATTEMGSTAANLTKVASSAATEAGLAQEASSTASASVQTVASSSEELSASIQEIAAQASRASSFVSKATEIAQDTDRQVSGLADAAERIGAVVEMIRAIAAQTNLLALNATIEAARAGEMGRGFAIVASEVKALAGQTAKATEDISSQITGIQSSTGNAVVAIRTITSTIKEIEEITTSMAAGVEEQDAAAREIAHSISIAANGSGQVAENVTSVTTSISSTSTEAHRVSSVSERLAVVSNELNRAVEDFLTAVASDVTERRRATRYSVDEAIIVMDNGRRLMTKLVDISTTGARTRHVSHLAEKSRIDLEWQDGFRIGATVVWVRNDQMGVAFDQPIGDRAENYAKAA